MVENTMQMITRMVARGAFPKLEEIDRIIRSEKSGQMSAEDFKKVADSLDEQLSTDEPDYSFFSTTLLNRIDSVAGENLKQCKDTLGTDDGAYHGELLRYTRSVIEIMKEEKAGSPLLATAIARFRWMMHRRLGTRAVAMPLMTESVLELWTTAFDGVSLALNEVR